MFRVSDWKIGTRISAAFAVVILISVAMCVFAYNRVRSIDQKVVVVSDNHVPSVVALSNCTLRINREIELFRLHAASSDQQEMAGYESRIDAYFAANAEDYKKYEAAPSDDQEIALYSKVKQDRLQYHSLGEDIKKESRIGTPETNALALNMINTRLVPLAEKYTNDIQAVVDYNNKGSVEGLDEVRKAVSATITGLAIGLILAVLLATVITVFIVRSITRPLALAVETLDQVAVGNLTASLAIDSKDEVGQMAGALNKAVEMLSSTLQEVADSAASASSSSQQLAAASESISAGAQEQAASLEETSASLEQITAAVRQSADNANQASQLAINSKDSAQQGQQVVTNAITAMSEINSASAKISDIISTIDEIAFQTNLLAVNAAVEAARAGDEGRGFAVVATEVRGLAQRSAVAAKEIKGLIQDSLRKVDAGSALVNRSGETLLGIVGSVKRVTDIVGEIAASSGEQSSGIEQVSSAMTQMDQVTQSNSAQTEELSATAQSLAGQASRLLELVNTFVLPGNRRSQDRSFHPSQRVDHSSGVGNGIAQSTATVVARTSQKPVAGRSAGRPSANKASASRSRSAAGHGSSPLVPAAVSAPVASDSSFEEF